MTFYLERTRVVLSYYEGFDVSDIMETVTSVMNLIANITSNINGVMTNETLVSEIESKIENVSLGVNDTFNHYNAPSLNCIFMCR